MKSDIPFRPFNTPLETGLRLLYILAETEERHMDLQRLIFYDYLIVHSGDVKNGINSLHPNIPHRTGEWVIKRQKISQGLDLMFSRQLISKKFTSDGIFYSSSTLTKPFLSHLSSEYAIQLKKHAKWVNEQFNGMSDDELYKYMNSQVNEWGAEFTMESILLEGEHE